MSLFWGILFCMIDTLQENAMASSGKSRADEIERILGPLIARKATRDLADIGLPTPVSGNPKMTLSEAIMLERGRPGDLIGAVMFSTSTPPPWSS